MKRKAIVKENKSNSSRGKYPPTSPSGGLRPTPYPPSLCSGGRPPPPEKGSGGENKANGLFPRLATSFLILGNNEFGHRKTIFCDAPFGQGGPGLSPFIAQSRIVQRHSWPLNFNKTKRLPSANFRPPKICYRQSSRII